MSRGGGWGGGVQPRPGHSDEGVGVADCCKMPVPAPMPTPPPCGSPTPPVLPPLLLRHIYARAHAGHEGVRPHGRCRKGAWQHRGRGQGGGLGREEVRWHDRVTRGRGGIFSISL